MFYKSAQNSQCDLEKHVYIADELITMYFEVYHMSQVTFLRL